MDLINAIQDKNTGKAKQILKTYLNIRKNETLDINKKDGNGDNPFLCCCRRNNIEIAKLLIEYANEKHIQLRINEKNNNRGYPLLLLFEYDNSNELLQLLINYANKNNIILDITSKDSDGDYPLLWSTLYNSIEKIKILFNYANKNNITLTIDERDINNMFTRLLKNPLLHLFHNKINIHSISEINLEIIELFRNGKNENKLNILFNGNSEIMERFDELLNLNASSLTGIELINAIQNKNTQKAKSILNYAIIKNTKINVNVKNEKGDYPLLCCCRRNNVEVARLLIQYADKNQILLNINGRNNNGGCPLLLNFEYNYDNELLQLIIDYSNRKNIVLDINAKDNDGDYPLLWSTIYNNIERINILFDYANKNNLKLFINEKDIVNIINRFLRSGILSLLHQGNIKSISEIKSEIIELFNRKVKENKLIITFTENSVMKQRFNKPSSLIDETEFINAIQDRNNKKAKLIIYDAIKNNARLNINGKDERGNYPMLCCGRRNNIEVAKLLIHYADLNHVKLTINEKNLIGGYPVLLNCEYNYSNELLELLINYANKNSMVLDITSKDNDGDYPLLWSTLYNNIGKIQMIFDYANKNNIILTINERDINNMFKRLLNNSLLKLYHNEIQMNSISEINSEIIELFYKKKCENKLNIIYSENSEMRKRFNKLSPFDETELINAIQNENSEKARTIMNSVIKTDATLNINGKDEKGNYPLLCCSRKNNIEIAKLLIQYANKNNIVLTINEKNYIGGYPVLLNFEYNYNTELLQLLMDYANRKNMVLDIISEDNGGDYPLLWGTLYNNTEKIKMMFDYADKNNIKLSINEKDIMRIINRINGNYNYQQDYGSKINNIHDINVEIIELFYKKYNENKLYISFKENSELTKRFKEISNNNNDGNDGDLAIVLYDFNGSLTNELSFKKSEYLIVTNWNIKNGWAFGYKRDDPQIKGMFPSALIQKCNSDNKNHNGFSNDPPSYDEVVNGKSNNNSSTSNPQLPSTPPQLKNTNNPQLPSAPSQYNYPYANQYQYPYNSQNSYPYYYPYTYNPNIQQPLQPPPLSGISNTQQPPSQPSQSLPSPQPSPQPSLQPSQPSQQPSSQPSQPSQPSQSSQQRYPYQQYPYPYPYPQYPSPQYPNPQYSNSNPYPYPMGYPPTNTNTYYQYPVNNSNDNLNNQ